MVWQHTLNKLNEAVENLRAAEGVFSQAGFELLAEAAKKTRLQAERAVETYSIRGIRGAPSEREADYT
jgi:hypothetical protein